MRLLILDIGSGVGKRLELLVGFRFFCLEKFVLHCFFGCFFRHLSAVDVGKGAFWGQVSLGLVLWDA